MDHQVQQVALAEEGGSVVPSRKGMLCPKAGKSYQDERLIATDVLVESAVGARALWTERK